MKSYHELLFKKLFGNNSDQCYTSILKSWSEGHGMYDRHFNRDDIIDVLINESGVIDSYFSLNTFIFRYTDLHILKMINREKNIWIPQQVRKTKNVRHLNAVVIDYDYYKIQEFKHLSPVEFWEQMVEPDLPYGLTPTAVIDSGRGLYLLYAFHDCSKKWEKAYRRVAEKLIDKHKHLGADPRCKDVTRVIRIPGSINSRSNKEVQVLVYNDTNYDLLKDFAFLWKKETKESLEEKVTSRTRTKSTKSRAGIRKTTFGRMYDDFKKLIDMRNKSNYLEGYRESMLYITSYEAQKVGYTFEQAKDFVVRLAKRMKVSDEKLIQSSLVTKVHNQVHSVATIIEKVEISEIEQEELDYLISSDLKKFRLNEKKRKGRKALGLTEKEQQVINRQHQVNLLKCIGLSNAEIARVIHVERQTIANDLNAIEKAKHRFALTINRIKAFNQFEKVSCVKDLREKLIEFKNYILAQLGLQRATFNEEQYLGYLAGELEKALENVRNRELQIIDTG